MVAAGLARSSRGGSRFGWDQAEWQQVWLGAALVAAGLAWASPDGSRFG